MSQPRCELCEAAPITPRHFEDAVCWIADCESCDVPMVVWRHHGASPPETDVNHMIGTLKAVAAERYGADGFYLDEVMRQIPDHFHAHARDVQWWRRRHA